MKKFILLLKNAGLLEEYVFQVERHNGMPVEEFMKVMPPSDWISAGFLWRHSDAKLQWSVLCEDWYMMTETDSNISYDANFANIFQEVRESMIKKDNA